LVFSKHLGHGEPMSEDEIWTDANEPDAMLIVCGKSIRYYTLGEAIMDWDRLPADRKKGASIRASSGRLFKAKDLAKGIRHKKK
jgi:hypothetical protein